MISRLRHFARLALAASSFLLCSAASTAQLGWIAVAVARPVDANEVKSRTEQLPKRLEGVDVVEHLEAKVPERLSFRDDRGRDVLYDEVVRGTLPVVLTLNYSNCPMLCSLQLTALVDGMKQLDLALGRDYRVITVSLDPSETPGSLSKTKHKYLARYGRPGVDESGWTFLSGSEQNIRAVARTLGFSYNFNEARGEYVHPAAFVIGTPAGVISRYLYGLEYHPRTLRLSLVEASEGKVGTTLDRLVLYCFHYDATEGRYAPVAMNIMRVVGGAFALALAVLLAVLWRAERRPKLRPLKESHPVPSLS